MSLFTSSSLLESARLVKLTNFSGPVQASARSILIEAANEMPEDETFDIFLSHSFLDADHVLGLKNQIEEIGCSVYVDWVTDKDLERSEASKETAEKLKKRMINSRCLFFATSTNSGCSKWMPWERGFFDGRKENKVAICPVSFGGTNLNEYKGQEYLSLYPYVDKCAPGKGMKDILWINESSNKFIKFSEWLDGAQPRLR